MTAPVFIKSVPRASIFLGYVEGFPETEVVLECEFGFSRHGFENGRFFPVDGKVAGLFVSGDARVAPLAFFNGFAMLSAAGDNFPHCLTDIFFTTGTCKHVYTFLLMWVIFCLTVSAEDASQFATAPECDVEASLFGRTFKGVRDGRSTVGQADEGFFLYLRDLIAGEGLG